MRSLFVILLVANSLLFGLAQGWFGSPRVEPGRQPAMMDTQINPQALSISVGEPAAR
jgi:hypothetical protein